MTEGPGKQEGLHDEEKPWTSMDDFERAFASLPSISVSVKSSVPAPGNRYRDRPEDIQAFFERFTAPVDPDPEVVAKEDAELRILRSGSALAEIYNLTGGFFYPKFLIGLGSESEEEFKRAFGAEIDGLWSRRKEEIPIFPDFSGKKELATLEDNIVSLQKKISEIQTRTVTTRRKIENTRSARTQARLKRDSGFQKVGQELTALREEQSRKQFRLGSLREDANKEIFWKKFLNLRMPRLSGEEYWEAFIIALDRLHTEKKKRSLMEDVLLEWSLKHAKDFPAPKSQVLAGGPARKLYEELIRIRDIVRNNPNEVNLRHAQLLYRNIKRLLPK